MRLFFYISYVFLFSLNANVAQGKLYFEKNCLLCHGNALAFASKKSYDKWIQYIAINGDVIYGIHKDSKKAVLSMKYFESEKYRDDVEHYRDFFLEYANDSKVSPSCP